MPELFLSPHIAEHKRREFAAEIAKRIDVDRRCVEFTSRLRREIDPRLVMVKAHDLIAPGTPLRPGFYHVLRFNEDAPMTVIPITENGRYVEPDGRVFTKLAAGNMTQRRVMDDIVEHDRRVERDAETAAQRAKDERREELRERANAGARAQVSMDRSVPWTQNANGRRPAR